MEEQAQTMDLCNVAILSHQLRLYHFSVNLVVQKMVFSDLLIFLPDLFFIKNRSLIIH